MESKVDHKGSTQMSEPMNMFSLTKVFAVFLGFSVAFVLTRIHDLEHRLQRLESNIIVDPSSRLTDRIQGALAGMFGMENVEDDELNIQEIENDSLKSQHDEANDEEHFQETENNEEEDDENTKRVQVVVEEEKVTSDEVTTSKTKNQRKTRR
jgi:hypothetical protein